MTAGSPSDRAAEARALDARILALVRRGPLAPFDEAAFGALAVDLCAHQARWCEVIARHLGGAAPRHWRDVPPLPSAAFKGLRVATFPPDEAAAAYRTSGTTGAERGEHHLDRIDLYQEASVAAFEAALLPDGARLPAVVLAPRPAVAPDSSLSAMLGWVTGRLTAGATWHADGDPDLAGAAAALRSAAGPVLLLGTSFALLMLCDHLAGTGAGRIALPPGSRVMDTGGTKGRTRAIEREELVALLGERLGVPATHVVNEYGMTELSSQLYTSTLMGRGPRWWAPPWIRARALDPETLRDVAAGEPGVLALVDVVNRGSFVAVRTADRGVVHADGSVEVLGRARGVEARGCSLVYEVQAGPPRLGAAPHTPGEVTALATAARAARSALARRPVASIAAALGRVSARWLDPADPIRREALATLPATTALAPATLAAGLDRSFGAFSAAELLALVAAELGDPEPFDRWLPRVPGGPTLSRPVGPALTLVVGAGNLPVPLALDVMCALLLRSAALVKPPSEDPLFAALLARSIAEVDPDLGAAVAVARWPGGSLPHEDAALALADAVVATGEDASVLALRRRASLTTRFVARGARLSVGLVAREATAPPHVDALAARIATDTLLWDQRGCLSPVAWLVEGPADALAAAVERALSEAARSLPAPLLLDPRIASLEERARVDVRALRGEPVRRTGRVVVDEGPLVPLAGRHVLLRPVGALSEAPALLDPWAGRLSNVLFAAPPDDALVEALLPLAPTRLCAVGRAQEPPAAWHHDGEPVLAPLVRWVDLEPLEK